MFGEKQQVPHGYVQIQCVAGPGVANVDISLRAPRGSHAEARLCRHARGRHGCLCKKLAAELTDCLANQARGCQHDACDERSAAAIKQDFINDVGHDSLQPDNTVPKR
jgi:hypothetical protein